MSLRLNRRLMLSRRALPLILVLLLVSGCRNTNRLSEAAEPENPAAVEKEIALRYATGIKAWEGEGYYRVHVFGSDSLQPTGQYLLFRDSTEIPRSVSASHHLIRIPIQRLAAVSTTHCALFSALDAREVIVAMSWSENLFDPELRSRAEAGDIAEISREGSLDLERLLLLQPDLVMTYLTTDPEYGEYYKMQQLGLPVLANAEFLEAHPLGQAEWIRLAGWLLDRDEDARLFFEGVAERYQAFRAKARGASPQPTVFTGMPYQGSWTVPRAESFAATYLSDAGATYVWSDQSGTGSLEVDMEAVMNRALTASFWIHPGAAGSLEQMQSADSRYARFSAWREGRVYNNDARLSPAGGNDYWESAIVRPDLVLADLIRIFHPGLLPDESLVYYRALPATKPE